MRYDRVSSGQLVDALLPLFDVELVALADAFTLQGFEWEHRDRRVFRLR